MVLSRLRNQLKQQEWIAAPYRQLRQTMWTTRVRAINLVLDTRLLPGHTEYVRFIIVSRGRSGTSLLRSLLNDHPQVVTFGEIFRKYGAIGWDRSDHQATLSQLHLIETDPVAFLETYLFRKYSTRITAVGFKLFYYHARNPEWEPVWHYLREQPDIRIIHLRRENVLATHLSLRRAFLTGKWSNNSGQAEYVPPLTLSYEECLEAFTKTQEWEEWTEHFFAGQQKLNICYEALSQDYESEMKRVQAFLGLDYHPTHPRLYKQNRQSLAGSIANYMELKECFSGTLWENFFED